MQNYSTVEKQYSDSNEFCSYKVTLNDNSIIYVPLDTANSDYQAIQDWVANGNTITDPNGD